jgi:hypothetical protein
MNMVPSKVKYLLFWLPFFFLELKAQQHNDFPLTLSPDKRHLVDHASKAFLIREISAWGLIQSLSEKDESAFMDSIRRKGFNTVLTCLTINHQMMAGHPPDWQGTSPFLKQWDFSTPNPLYFDHVDRFFKLAAEKNLLVLAVPAYLGYRDDGSQGWWDEILNPSNDSTKMRSFGQYLGNRYHSIKNLIWVAGGDNNGSGVLYPYVNNLYQGIKEKDPDHLWTGHFDANLKVNWSTENPLYASFMDMDGLYVWSESAMGSKGPQYVSELKQFQKGKMIIQLDQSYEHDLPHYADNENDQWIRRKMYEGLLNGCAGTSFSPGEPDNQCYTFKNWKPLMNTPGMWQVSYCFHLFASRAWENLVPDQSDKIIVSGRGQFGELNYICAAKSTTSNMYIMYIPDGRTFYLNTSEISGQSLFAFWYNPRTGKSMRIGGLPVSDQFGFATPSSEDWVLVLEKSK